MHRTNILKLTVASLALAVPATAQQLAEGEALGGAEFVSLADWRYDDLYASGISADAFMDDIEVFDETGEDIGEVEDMIIAPDGTIMAIVAEVGGVWDIGDTHVSIPFDQVQMMENGGGIVVPINEDNLDAYDFDADWDWLWEGDSISSDMLEGDIVSNIDGAFIGRARRASELIGSYARISSDDAFSNFGYVNDVILRDGRVDAVVVQPYATYGRGYRAYPYAPNAPGYGWSTASPYYDMPYTAQDLEGQEAFDYERMEMSAAEE